MLEWGRPQMTIWCMCIACCIPKATNIHSEYVIIIDFSLPQRLHKGVSVPVLCFSNVNELGSMDSKIKKCNLYCHCTFTVSFISLLKHQFPHMLSGYKDS